MRVFFLLSFIVSACGYRIGDLIPPDTIAVVNFQNKTLYRGYEISLTEGLVSEILMRTPLKVMPYGKANTVLSGDIVSIKASTVTKDETRAANQLDVTVSVEVEWKDVREKRTLLPKTRVSETVQVIVSRGENLESAITQSLRKLARFIVYAMEHPYWEKEEEVASPN